MFRFSVVCVGVYIHPFVITKTSFAEVQLSGSCLLFASERSSAFGGLISSKSLAPTSPQMSHVRIMNGCSAWTLTAIWNSNVPWLITVLQSQRSCAPFLRTLPPTPERTAHYYAPQQPWLVFPSVIGWGVVVERLRPVWAWSARLVN